MNASLTRKIYKAYSRPILVAVETGIDYSKAVLIYYSKVVLIYGKVVLIYGAKLSSFIFQQYLKLIKLLALYKGMLRHYILWLFIL